MVPHVLKHTAVTWAFQNGMTLEDAVDYFATSAATQMEVYRHHSPHHQTRAVSVMDQIGAGFIAANVADRQDEQVTNSLKYMVYPGRFERATSAFGGKIDSVKSLSYFVEPRYFRATGCVAD